MTDTVENLILDLLEWIRGKERSYQETMEAWRTSCPRLSIWEDANERALIERESANGSAVMHVTPAGLALLREKRPSSFQGEQCQDGNEPDQPTIRIRLQT